MANTFGSYKRVFMLGIDGMGAFNEKTDTPNMDKLFANGATTYTALASRPTISAQCWTSMLTGATPEVHKLTNGDMHPIPELPTIFKFIKDVFPDAETAAFTDWSPIAKEIISPDGGLTAYDVGHDDELCERLLTYLDDHEPKMLFIQFDSVDGAGHRAGYGSPTHLERITHVDEMLGKLIAKYEEKGIFEDTLFIVTADHGGTPGENGHGGGHGGWTEGEKLVFLGIAGKNIKKGQIGEVSLRDFPAIVLHALGVKAPEFNPKGYAAQMPLGVFEDAGIEDRYEVYPKQKIFEHKERVQPAKDSAEYIGNFLDENRIKFWQTYENGIEDETGKCKVTTEKGLVKTYNNGFIGKSGEFGNGVLKVEGVEHSEVFTFAMWYYTTADSRWLDLFSNKDGKNPSFTLAPLGEHVGIFIKNPDGSQDNNMQTNSSENAIANVWVHFMFEVDTVKNEINGYVNFKKVDTLTFKHDLAPHFDMENLLMACDQCGNELFYKIVDDVMIIDGPAPVEELEKYYKG